MNSKTFVSLSDFIASQEAGTENAKKFVKLAKEIIAKAKKSIGKISEPLVVISEISFQLTWKKEKNFLQIKFNHNFELEWSFVMTSERRYEAGEGFSDTIIDKIKSLL